ncbi:MAG: triose-phosphate isomerase [Elusimicrobiota bacterium]|nr:triose-phosphate isomerase [Endomicrobiia bacterium]MDW8165553.1 triose-phosphate isomerase [Elusimicrobiota bacterium]
MRKQLIAANWKMYKTILETKDFIDKFLILIKSVNINNREIVLCPPFTSLYVASEMLKNTNIKLGAQNMYIEEKGAFTGEISPVMIKELNCEYVILGHSERRKYFNETDEFINKKMLMALKYGLIPIVCIGETLQEREENKTFEVLKYQVENSLANLTHEQAAKIVIAYEPVWAIGTGKNATPQQAEEAQSFIREVYANMYGKDVAERIRILYGGSIKPENFKEIISQKNVDGGLVGGASLDPESFFKICCV